MKLITFITKTMEHPEFGTTHFYSIIKVEYINGLLTLTTIENLLDDCWTSESRDKSKDIAKYCKKNHHNILARDDNNIYGAIDSQSQNFLPFENQDEIKNSLLKFYESELSHGGL